MVDTGFVIAGAGASVDTGSTVWSSPGNITADDGSNATTFDISSPFLESDTLRASSFGLSVPVGATIDGIEIQVDGSFGGNAIVSYINVGKDGSTLGTAKTPNTGQSGLATYGGPSDLWGLSWTAAEVNSANFLAEIRADGAGNSYFASVDAIWIKVYYTTTTEYSLDMDGLAYDYSLGGLSFGISAALAGIGYNYSFGALSFGLSVSLETLTYEYTFPEAAFTKSLTAALDAIPSYEYSFSALGLELCHFTWNLPAAGVAEWEAPLMGSGSWTPVAAIDSDYTTPSAEDSSYTQESSAVNTHTEEGGTCEDEI